MRWNKISDKVKDRLMVMRILPHTTHDDRVELDALIEQRTGKYCDDGVSELTDEQIMELLNHIWNEKKKKKKKIPAVV